jgi:hypothetical protein
MPIRCRKRRQSRSILVVLIYQRFLAAGVFPHLSPHVEMPHRHLDQVKAIEHLIDIFRPDMLLGLFEDRAAEIIERRYSVQTPINPMD